VIGFPPVSPVACWALEERGRLLVWRMGSLWLVGLSAIVAGIALGACGASAAEPVNTSLATQACHGFLLVSSNSPGLLGGGGLPQGQTWTQVLDSASGDAKASGDGDLYRAIQSASPFIVGSHNPAAVTRSQFDQAEGHMNNVGDLCGAYGITFPPVGSPTEG
jgi:hypothetical protein